MSYLRKCIERLEAYQPGEQLAGFIKLNTNENPYPPSPKVLSALKKAIDEDLHLYPDPSGEKVRKKLASIYKVKREQIILGNGSDELLSIIMRSFINKGEKVVITYPSYVLYKVLARIQEGEIIEIDLNEDYSLSLDIPPAKLIFLANPNTPSGVFIPKNVIKNLCKESKAVIILDEAYVDFAEDNCLELVDEFNNLIILRTLSKSFSLAGMRIGFGVGEESLIKNMCKVKDTYNLNRLSLIAAEAALNDLKYVQGNIQSIIKERNLFTQDLKKIGFYVYPSQANFVLVKTKKAFEIYTKLKENKILVRYFNQYRLKECLRITIGTAREMRILRNTLKKLI